MMIGPGPKGRTGLNEENGIPYVEMKKTIRTRDGTSICVNYLQPVDSWYLREIPLVMISVCFERFEPMI